MKVLISWATWFLWKLLTHMLIKQWHAITILTRDKNKAYKIFANENVTVVTRDTLCLKQVAWIEIVVHLTGASLLRFPRTTRYKKTLYDSRIQTTRHLVNTLPSSCHTFVSASAIWYYPSSLTTHYAHQFINTSPSSFLEKMCVDREYEASLAKTTTRRVVYLRTWIIEWEQWFLPIITTAIKRYGWVIPWSWKQWISTISQQDRLVKVCHIIMNSEITWPINIVSKSESLESYMQRIATSNQRPLLFHIPERLIKFALWEFSSILLSSQYIKIKKPINGEITS
jgi:NAD dependent epimerase/dehydratase family enzyme